MRRRSCSSGLGWARADGRMSRVMLRPGEVVAQANTRGVRDNFGAHTYKRVDKPDVGPVHTDWPSLVG